MSLLKCLLIVRSRRERTIFNPYATRARAADFQFWAQDEAYPSVRKQLLNYFPKQIYINNAYSYYISCQCISLKVKKGKL